MSIVDHLIDIQRGIGKKSVVRRLEVLTRCLITSEGRKFVVTEQLINSQSPNPFTFLKCGRIFHQQAKRKTIVSCSSAHPSRTEVTKILNGSKPFYHQKIFNTKFNVNCHDHLVIAPAEHLHKEHSIFYIEDKKYLSRLCFETGQLKEKILLSESLSFEEIELDVRTGLIGIKSTRCIRAGDSSLFTIAIFSWAPLRFELMLEAKSSTFGQKIKNVQLSEGLITIYFDRKASIYSLEAILKQCKTRVGDMEEGEQRSRIKLGIEECCEALFSVNCYQCELILSSYPWSFLIKKKSDKAEVWNVSAKKTIGEIEFLSKFAGMEVDSISFSPCSANLIHICNRNISIYSLHEERMSLSMTYDAETPGLARPLAVHYTTTRSGRVACQAANDVDPVLTHNFSIAMDGDTNILAILSVAATGLDHVILRRLTLFDSRSFNYVRKVKLGLVLNSSIHDLSCNLTLEGVHLFAEIHDRNILKGFVISLVEKV